jgi:hypothetical protein
LSVIGCVETLGIIIEGRSFITNIKTNTLVTPNLKPQNTAMQQFDKDVLQK